jgi:hypothetical protein
MVKKKTAGIDKSIKKITIFHTFMNNSFTGSAVNDGPDFYEYMGIIVLASLFYYNFSMHRHRKYFS